jgi:mevalonate kinase
MGGLDRIRRGIGRGKLILFGEHAAVYGHAALGIPLDTETRVEISPEATPGWRAPELSAADRAVVKRLLETLGDEGESGTVRVCSTVPRAVGFGSSAALCVALAAATSGAEPPYGRRVWARAHGAERLFHGTPSGVDTGLALLEGMRAFRPDPPSLPEETRLPEVTLALVVGATPRGGSTAALVAGLRDRVRARDVAALSAVAELGRTAEEACSGATAGGEVGRAFGTLADRAQLLLASLGLSTAETDALLACGRELGALGGKLSGAGGGGAFYLVAPDRDAARRIAAELAGAAPSLVPSVPCMVRAVLWSGSASEDVS